MHLQPDRTALDLEIQAFAATLRRSFRGASWDVVASYAAEALSVVDRADARWQDVESRDRT